MKRGRQQAKDIDTATFLRTIDDLANGIGRKYPDTGAGWVFTWDIFPKLPDVHEKVVMAKLRALLRRKLIRGCACGCRGDFELTQDGREEMSR